MFARCFSSFALSIMLGGFAVVPSVSDANPEYLTDRGCRGCHTPPVTCTGCHGHGTHDTMAKSTMNLVATTEKNSYVVGDDISVTLSGGYKPTGWSSGWLRVNVYASNGTLLVSNSADCPYNASSYPANCDLPVTLKTRAVSGMTNLYVAWMGNEFDKTGAAQGTSISAIGVGKRAAPLPAPTGHVEEIVLTNTFSVTTASESGGGGGGSLDWVFISGLLGLRLLRRIARVA